VSELTPIDVEIDVEAGIFDNLLGYWLPSINGDIVDISGRNDRASYVNGAQVVIDNGKIGADFDGTDDAAVISTPHALIDNWTNFSILLEFKTSPGSSGTEVICEQLNGTGDGSFGIYIDSDGTLHFFAELVTSQDDDTGVNVRDGLNHVVVIVRNEEDQNRYVYLDGELISTFTDTKSGPVSSTEQIDIGGRHSGTNFYFDGVVYRLALLDRAWNEAEALRVSNDSNYGLIPIDEAWIPPQEVVGATIPVINQHYRNQGTM